MIVGGLLGGQERDQLAELDRLAESADGDPRRKLGLDPLRRVRGGRGEPIGDSGR